MGDTGFELKLEFTPSHYESYAGGAKSGALSLGSFQLDEKLATIVTKWADLSKPIQNAILSIVHNA